MHQQNSYPYPFTTGPTSPRYASSNSTSSAQSASANPDEDWTKISDLAERRRIQNRIAQRNYRKKLKRRLEDLERRAGSSSASPEQTHAELIPTYHPQRRAPDDDDASKKRRTKPSASLPTRTRSPTSPSHSRTDDSPSGMFSRQYTRQLSASPPPAFTYSYTLPDAPAPYPQHAPYQALPSPYSDYQGQSIYLPPRPTLPSMPGYDSSSGAGGAASSKYENGFLEDEMIGHFNMTYAAGLTDMPSAGGQQQQQQQQSFQDENAYTPPLSLSLSFEHSRAGSPSEPSLMCPGTPVSIPLSPQFLFG